MTGYLVRISSLLVATVLGTGGCTVVDSETEGSASELCTQPLSNVVVAPNWVRDISPIRTYRYESRLDSVDVNLELLGDDDVSLGTMAVRQVYGDPAYPDGAMHAVLRRSGFEPMSVTTVGEMIDADHYRVRARLEHDGVGLDVAATFMNRFCFGPSGPQSPSCVGNIALGEGSYAVPSCGVLLDEMLWLGRAPTLERLEYGAALSGDQLPSLSATRFEGGYRILPVLDHEGLEDPAAVAQWAREAGVDELLGSEGEVLLTTAFLDRSWWRELERHASHCVADIEAELVGGQSLLPRSCGQGSLGPQSEPVGSVTQAACEGSAAQPSASDWSDDGDSEDTAGFWGDPHMTSLDGTSFDFQAAGEFVLVESSTEPQLVIQARFEPMATSSKIPACLNISVGTAVAVLAGQQRITAYARPAWSVWLDGTELSSGQAVAVETGGVLRVTRGALSMEWPNGQRIEFSGGNTGRLGVALPASRRGRVRGLLGQFDGETSNDFATRDGRLLLAPPSFSHLYEELGASWRVSDDESLFDYEPGESAATFALEGFPSQSVSLSDLPADALEAALTACSAREISEPVALQDCVLDVVCAGSTTAADQAVGTPLSLASLPPSLPGVMVEGAIVYRPAPADLLLTAWPDAGSGQTCTPPEARPTYLHKEQASFELASDISVDIGAGSGSAGTIASGTQVASYLLHRRPGDPGGSTFGTVYFSRPIIGVIYSDELLDASDPVVGSPSTTYPTGPRALDSDDEVWTEIEARTLTVLLAGDDVDQIRILTEVP
jgi:von Willebrand factor type D domain